MLNYYLKQLETSLFPQIKESQQQEISVLILGTPIELVVAVQEITKELQLNEKALLYFAALQGEMQIKIKFSIRQMNSLHLKVSNN
jgi:hypothetical protein